MPSHDRNRHQKRRCGTQGRGFSMLELVGAIVLFISAVALISTAVTTMLGVQARTRTALSLDTTLAALVEQAAASGFDAVVSDTFPIPQRCVDSPALIGSAAHSCVTVDGAGYRVSWTVTRTGRSGPATSADTVTLSAAAFGPWEDVRSHEIVMVAAAPAAGPGRAAVRLHLRGDWDSVPHVALVRDSDRSELVAAVATGSVPGVVTVSVDPGRCTAIDPCRVALVPDTQAWGYTNTHALAAAVAFGDDGVVVVAAGAVTDVNVDVYRRGDAVVRVEAVNPGSGRRSTGSQAPHQGSLCLWATFSDGWRTHTAPACNGVNADAVVMSVYEPDRVGAPGVMHPLPTSTILRVTADAAGGTCPVVDGQQYASVSGWQPVTTVGVCSTWTWGHPTTWQPAGNDETPFAGAAFTLQPGERVAAVAGYSDGDAAPAAGHLDDALFAHPRDASQCPGWSSGSCAPAWLTDPPARFPETSTCPGAHCLSSATPAPTVTSLFTGAAYDSGIGWPYAVTVAPSTQERFAMRVRSAGDVGTVTARLVTVPATGTLEVCDPAGPESCTTVAAAGPLGVFNSGDDLYWRYTAGASGGRAEFTVALTSDGVTENEEAVMLVADETVAVIDPFPGAVVQGGTATLWVRGFSTVAGDPVDAGTVTWVGPAGTSGAESAAWSAGWASTGIAGATATAGGATVAVSSGGADASHPFDVTADVGSVTVSAVNVTDGGDAGTVDVTVSDRAGAPLSGAAAIVTAQRNSALFRAVNFDPPLCVTGTAGTCTTAVVASGASAGAFDVLAAASGVQSQTQASVLPAAAMLRVEPLTVREGAAGTLVVRVLDGAGDPVTGVEVTAQADGLVFSAAFADSTGMALLEVTAAAFSAGVANVEVAASGVTANASVTVLPAPATVVAAPTLNVQADVLAAFNVNVRGSFDQAVGAADVTVQTSADDVRVTPRAATDSGGNVTMHVLAGPGAPAVFTLEVRSGSAVTTVEVNVQ
jgi:type II secretory pathway pseudopilin PulG